MSLWDDAAPIHRNIGDLNTLASLLNNGWDEPAAIRRLFKDDRYLSGVNTNWNHSKNDTTYRVFIEKTSGRVEVVCFGMNTLDNTRVGIYTNQTELPQWIQDRLAVLIMIDPTPPAREIEGVGVRVNQETFWVFSPPD
jgi:hypothetical protein